MSKIKIKGLDQLQSWVKQYPQIVHKHLKIAVGRAALELIDIAKQEAPKDTKLLKKSLRASFFSGGLGASIGTDVKYALFVHEGTKPHTIRPTRKKVLANRKTNQVFGKLVKHPGTKANPFFERTLNEGQDEVNTIFQKALVGIAQEINK